MFSRADGIFLKRDMCVMLTQFAVADEAVYVLDKQFRHLQRRELPAFRELCPVLDVEGAGAVAARRQPLPVPSLIRQISDRLTQCPTATRCPRIARQPRRMTSTRSPSAGR